MASRRMTLSPAAVAILRGGRLFCLSCDRLIFPIKHPVRLPCGVPDMAFIKRFAALLLIIGTGCGQSGPPPKPDGVAVGGKILLPTGSPVTGGILVLRPVAGIHGATAPIQKDGTFELVDSEGNKSVVPGKYQVFVRVNNPDLKALATAVNKRYQSTEDGDSDVLVDIQTARNDLVIKLNR
jgi:hypothetical protein